MIPMPYALYIAFIVWFFYFLLVLLMLSLVEFIMQQLLWFSMFHSS